MQAYELDVAKYSGKTINATEGGAFIQGTEVMPLQKAIDIYLGEVINPLSIIEGKTAFFKNKDQIGTYKKIGKKLTKAVEDLKEMADGCDDGIQRRTRAVN